MSTPKDLLESTAKVTADLKALQEKLVKDIRDLTIKMGKLQRKIKSDAKVDETQYIQKKIRDIDTILERYQQNCDVDGKPLTATVPTSFYELKKFSPPASRELTDFIKSSESEPRNAKMLVNTTATFEVSHADIVNAYKAERKALQNEISRIVEQDPDKAKKKDESPDEVNTKIFKLKVQQDNLSEQLNQLHQRVQDEATMKILSGSPPLPHDSVSSLVAYSIAKLKIKEASPEEQKVLINQCKKSGWKAKFGGFGNLQSSMTIDGFTLKMSEIDKMVAAVYMSEGSKIKTELQTALGLEQKTEKDSKPGI